MLAALEIFIAVSFATLVFRATPSFLPLGIGAFLAGGALHYLLVGRASSVPGIASSVQDAPVAVLTGVAAVLAADTAVSEEAVFATTLLAVMVAGLLTGVVMVVLGSARLGRLARYVPYPVQAGFLGGTGVILLDGGLAVGAGSGLSAATVERLGDPAVAIAFGATLVLGLVLVVGSSRIPSPLAIPAIFVSGIAAFYVIALVVGATPSALRMGAWLPEAFPSGMLWQPSMYGHLRSADPGAVLAQAASIATVPIVSLLGMLLNTTGIELDRRTSIDVDRELQVTGATNAVAAVAGSVPGFAGVSLTGVAARLGAPTRTAVMLGGAIVLSAALGGAVAVSYLPLFASGGLLAFLGIAFLHEYVWRARVTVTRGEHLALLAVVAVIGVWGYAPGVMLGLVVSVFRFLVAASRTDPVRRRSTAATLASRAHRTPRQRGYLRENGARVQVVELEGHLFFGTAAKLLSSMQELITSQEVTALVIDFSGVQGMDATAVSSFRRLGQDADAHDTALFLASANPAVRAELVACGAADLVEPGRAFSALDEALEHAEDLLLATADLGDADPDPFVTAFGGDEGVAGWRAHFERVEFAAGSVILTEGDADKSLYVIESGLVRVERSGDNGVDVRLRTLGPGELLGEFAMYQDQRSAGAVVESDAVLWHLSGRGLSELVDASPATAARLHEALARVITGRLVRHLEPGNGHRV